MNKFIIALGALAFTTACVKTTDGCDTSDSGECEETGTETGVEGCEEFTGAFGIGVDFDACSVPDGASADWDVNWDCSADTNDYWFEIYTIGWAKNVELYIDQNTQSAWTEYHNSDDMIGKGDSYESYDEDGYWDYYYLYMQNSDSVSDVQADPTKTLYVCGDGRIATLSWFFIANADADSSVDCIAWGADAGVFDETSCGKPDWI